MRPNFRNTTQSQAQSTNKNDHSTSQVSSVEKENITLRSAMFRRVHVSDEEAARLAASLESPNDQTVHRVEFRKCSISSQALVTLAEALPRATNLQELTIIGPITSSGWLSSLIRALKNNTTLIRLDLRSVGMTTSAAHHLAMTLCHHGGIRQLGLGASADDDITPLIEALNPLSSKGTAQPWMHVDTLTLQGMGNCEAERFCELLCGAISGNPTISAIELTKAPLSLQQVDQLIDAMLESSSLTSLKVLQTNTLLSDKQRQRITDIARRNKDRQRLVTAASIRQACRHFDLHLGARALPCELAQRIGDLLAGTQTPGDLWEARAIALGGINTRSREAVETARIDEHGRHLVEMLAISTKLHAAGERKQAIDMLHRFAHERSALPLAGVRLEGSIEARIREAVAAHPLAANLAAIQLVHASKTLNDLLDSAQHLLDRSAFSLAVRALQNLCTSNDQFDDVQSFGTQLRLAVDHELYLLSHDSEKRRRWELTNLLRDLEALGFRGNGPTE